MKSLVVFFTRSDNTKVLAKMIADAAEGELEEVKETGISRRGLTGYLRAAKSSWKKESAEIAEVKQNPADFDVIFVGTPVWAWKVSPAIRSYLSRFKLGGKPVAFFCTMAGGGDDRAFDLMKELTPDSKLMGTFSVRSQELGHREALRSRVEEWIEDVKRKLAGGSSQE